MTATLLPPHRVGPAGRAMIALAKRLNPLVDPLASRGIIGLLGVIHHRGRRSGRTYHTPIAIRPTVDGFVIPLPYGESTDWCSNVLAAGSAVVTVHGVSHPVTSPEVIGRSDASPAYPLVLRPVLRVLGIDRFLRVHLA